MIELTLPERDGGVKGSERAWKNSLRMNGWSVNICYLNAMSSSGHGAVQNTEGEVELDAIIMDGSTLASGAVSSVRNIANPVTLARAVMEQVSF